MRLCLIILITCWAGTAAAETIHELAGTWVSPDGTSRQSYTPRMDGAWYDTRMWFKSGDEWQLVGAGGLFQEPGKQYWTSITRAREMQGMVYFETRITPADEGFSVSNLSSMADGTSMLTEEVWRFDGPDKYFYTIYQLKDGARQKWFEGSWRREAK